MDIQVTVGPDPRALARATRYQVRTYVAWVRGVGMALAVVALFAFVTPGWWLVGVVAATVGVAYQFVPWLRVRRWVNERIQNSVGPRTFRFTEEGVGFSSAVQTTQTAWKGYTRIVDTGEDLLLTFARQHVVAVPKDAFTPDQFNELTVFLSGQGLLAGPKR